MRYMKMQDNVCRCMQPVRGHMALCCLSVNETRTGSVIDVDSRMREVWYGQNDFKWSKLCTGSRI